MKLPTLGAPGAIVLSLAACLGSGAAVAAPELAVHLMPSDTDGTLVFELRNAGEEPVSVARVGTPLEAVPSEDAFAVTRTRKGWPLVERLPYAGRLVKRGPPRPEDFVTLAPGESLSAHVDIARDYAVEEGDDYRVDFAGEFVVGPDLTGSATGSATARSRTSGEATLARPRSNALELHLEPSLERLLRARPPTFAASCDATQRDQLVAATAAAEGLAGEALSSLNELPVAQRTGSPRYTTWFGAYDAGRYDTVAQGYTRILDTLSDETLNYDCGCTERGTYAYVYPLEPPNVYLCPQFFATELLGTDSRAGTLVHELSHFAVLVGTDDVVYGQSAASALATNAPDDAVRNADNYEYFAENTPTLAMTGSGGPVEPGTNLPPDDGPGNGPGDRTFTPLASNGAEGSLAEGELALYSVTGADTVTLDTSNGDADLYVFADPGLNDSDLICDSQEEGTLQDVCELPDADATYYVVVLGYLDSSYRVAADVTRTADPTAPAAPATALAPGSSTAGRLTQGESALFTTTGPASMTLTSLEGDADLLVFGATPLTVDTLVCRSLLTGSVDTCDVANGGTLYIAVTAYTDTSFSLDVGAGTTPSAPTEPAGPTGPTGPTGPFTPRPSDDDPTLPPPTVIGGGSAGGGGGSGGWEWLLVGGALLLLRGRRTAVVVTRAAGTVRT